MCIRDSLEEHGLTAACGDGGQPDRTVRILEHGQCQTQAVAAHHAVPFKYTDTAPGIALFEITAGGSQAVFFKVNTRCV